MEQDSNASYSKRHLEALSDLVRGGNLQRLVPASPTLILVKEKMRFERLVVGFIIRAGCYVPSQYAISDGEIFARPTGLAGE